MLRRGAGPVKRRPRDLRAKRRHVLRVAAAKWQPADGRTLWATFSCHDAGEGGACGKHHGRLDLMQVTLTLSG